VLDMVMTASQVGSVVDLGVLGPLRATTKDGPAPLGGPRQRTALGLLVARVGLVVPAETMIDELWGEEPSPGARSTLQTLVSNLRSALGGEIEMAGGGYRLTVDPERVDAVRFEGLVRKAAALVDADPRSVDRLLGDALALWRGAPYADTCGAASLAVECRRLEEARLRALELRIDARLALGHHADLVGELEALTFEHPFREAFRHRHMLALYRSGRQVDALRAYRATRDRLAEEFGLDPTPMLAHLEERILRQDPELAHRRVPDRVAG
jgi:DNA-binding SARP family transcriptional activator